MKESRTWLVVMSLLLSAAVGLAVRADTATVMIEDFSLGADGVFPPDWKSRRMGKAKNQYLVKHEGANRYLEANSNGDALTIAKQFKYDLKEFPFLSWNWKVVCMPSGANEQRKETQDSAAGIYVIFPGSFLRFPEAIKYVWSSSLPKGTVIQSPYSSKTKIIVLENHTSPRDQWVREEVNAYEDYRRLFGKEPDKNVEGIGILSDSDNTQTTAAACYDDIAISREAIARKASTRVRTE